MLVIPLPLAAAIPHAGELVINSAGLVDLDVTFFVQFALFLALVFTLPRLIFTPLLERFSHRQERTEGARSQAKAMLKDADKQVFVYEEATAKQKQRALAERAAARADAQSQAAELVENVKKKTHLRITQGIATLVQAEAAAKAEIDKEAAAISLLIADKIVEG